MTLRKSTKMSYNLGNQLQVLLTEEEHQASCALRDLSSRPPKVSMEESSQLLPVLVEPMSTIDLTEIPSRSRQATPSPRGDVGSCAIMSEGTKLPIPRIIDSRCLKVTFNPETQNEPGCISRNTGSEMSSASPQRYRANTPPSKDDVLSVVIEKLTELVNDSERIKEASAPSVCRRSKRMGSPKRVDPLYRCPKCPCIFTPSAKQLQSKEAVRCRCCETADNAGKLMECKGKAVKGQLKGLPASTEDSKVNCELCSHVAVSYVELLYHLLSKHEGAKICKCKLCDFFTTIEIRIQEHATAHHAPRVYRCSICLFVTDKVVGLRQHMKDHDKHRELLLKCSECGFSCQCEDILRNHMWEHVPSISKTSSKTRKPNFMEMIPTANPESNRDGEMSEPVPNPAFQTQTTDKKQPYIFKCFLCGYLCDRLATLKAHAWRHAGEKGCTYPVADDDECLMQCFSSAPSQASYSGKSCLLESSSNSIKAAESLAYDVVRDTDDTNEREVLAEHESKMSQGCCFGPTISLDESSSCHCEGMNIPPSSVPHIKELLNQKKRQKLSQKSTEATDVGKKSFVTEQDRLPTSEEETRIDCPSASHQNNSLSKTPEFQASNDIFTVPCENLAENGKPVPKKGSKSSELQPQLLVIDPVDPLVFYLDPDMPISEPAAVVETITEQNSALPHQEQLETTDGVFNPPPNRPESVTRVCVTDLSPNIFLASLTVSEVTETTAQYAVNDDKCLQKRREEVPQKSFEEDCKNLTIPQAVRDDTTDSCDEIQDGEKSLDVTRGQEESVPSSTSTRGHLFLQTYQVQDFVSSSVKPQENPTKHLMTPGAQLRHVDVDLIDKSAVVEKATGQTPPRSENLPKSNLYESEQMSCQESTKVIIHETVFQSKRKEGSVINPGSPNHGSTDGSLQIAQRGEGIEERQLKNAEIEPNTGRQKRVADLTASDMVKEAKRICNHDEKSNAEMSLPIIKEGLCAKSTKDGQGRSVIEQDTKLGRDEMPSDINSDEDSIVKFFMNVISGCDKPFQCKLCSQTFETYNSLKQHLNVHLVHNSFHCPLCKKCFESLDNLKLHILEHCNEPHSCLENSAFFQTENDELQVHRQSHTSLKEFKCNECSITMLTLADYARHCRNAHDNLGKPPVRCSHCGEGFINTNTLLLHTLSCPVRKMRSCKECGFTSESTEGVQDHVKECHQKSKFYKCDLCDYKSSAKNGIKNHMKFHSKDRPYKCQQCSFTGAYPQSLRSHMRMHMQPDWRPDCLPSDLPEQYKCKLCCYTCSYLPSLKSHMWRHASDPNYSYKGNQNITTDAATTSNSRTGTTANDNRSTAPPISNPAFQGPNERVGVLHNQVTFCCQECGLKSTDRAQLVEHLKTHLP